MHTVHLKNNQNQLKSKISLLKKIEKEKLKLTIISVDQVVLNDKTQNLLPFSLKCHPIYPEIHKDPSIGAQT